MKRVLLTGMSGTGKSTVVEALVSRGYKAIDTDYGGFSELVDVPDDEPTGLEPGRDWVWREDRIEALLSAEDGGALAEALFIGGCSSNQGRFYPRFDHVILLTASVDVISDRLRTRTNNPYGKRPEEVSRAISLKQTIEPMLKEGADHVVDTDAPLDRVIEEVLRISVAPSGSAAEEK